MNLGKPAGAGVAEQVPPEQAVDAWNHCLITAVPEGFRVHRTIQRFLENRRKAIESGSDIDWATGEALAFCSLLLDGNDSISRTTSCALSKSDSFKAAS